MAWHSGRYYVRKVRQGKQVRSEYVGGGALGALIAGEEARERYLRRAEAEAWKLRQAEWLALDALVAGLGRLAGLLLRAQLLAAGYHQHDRGSWRKRRARRPAAPAGEPAGGDAQADPAGVEAGGEAPAAAPPGDVAAAPPGQAARRTDVHDGERIAAEGGGPPRGGSAGRHCRGGLVRAALIACAGTLLGGGRGTAGGSTRGRGHGCQVRVCSRSLFRRGMRQNSAVKLAESWRIPRRATLREPILGGRPRARSPPSGRARPDSEGRWGGCRQATAGRPGPRTGCPPRSSAA